MDLLELAVSEGLLGGGDGIGGVLVDVELEGLGVVACGCAEGGDDKICLEGLGGICELERKVFVCLFEQEREKSAKFELGISTSNVRYRPWLSRSP